MKIHTSQLKLVLNVFIVHLSISFANAQIEQKSMFLNANLNFQVHNDDIQTRDTINSNVSHFYLLNPQLNFEYFVKQNISVYAGIGYHYSNSKRDVLYGLNYTDRTTSKAIPITVGSTIYTPMFKKFYGFATLNYAFQKQKDVQKVVYKNNIGNFEVNTIYNTHIVNLNAGIEWFPYKRLGFKVATNILNYRNFSSTSDGYYYNRKESLFNFNAFSDNVIIFLGVDYILK